MSNGNGNVSNQLPKYTVDNHSFLAEELLIPNTDKTDGSRTNMVCSHLSQLLVLNDSELPLVFTNFENQVGRYSSGIKYATETTKIVAIFEFNQYDKLILLRKGDTLDILHKRYSKNITENFGYVYHHNEKLKEPNAIIRKNELMYHNSMYDKEGNFKYGVNLKTVYLPYKGKTYEDPIVISESASKKLSHSVVDTYYIMLNQNDVLIKPLPRVGEYITNSILTVRRRINNSTVLSDFKEEFFDRTLPDDVVFYGDGMVTDIKVYCNNRKDLEYPYNSLLKETEQRQKEVYNDFLEFLERKNISKLKFSEEVKYWKREAVDYLSKVPFSYEKTQYDGNVVVVTVTRTEKCQLGSKLTNRYGGKGVVSLILPDHEMPQTEDGRYADVVSNTLGVIGRMNPSQNYEHELNYAASEILRTSTNVSEFKHKIMKFLYIASPKLAEYIDGLSGIEASMYLEEMYNKETIYIHQPPFFDNITLDKLEKIMVEFGIEKTKFKDIQSPLIFGKIYFVKLKHEPQKKFSVRSTGTTNLLDTPHKSNEKQKRGNAPFNTNPVRFGEQEFYNLQLLAKPEIQHEFIKHYASETSERQNLLEDLLTKDIDDIFEFTRNESSLTNSAQTVRSIFRSIGVDLYRSEERESNDVDNSDDINDVEEL